MKEKEPQPSPEPISFEKAKRQRQPRRGRARWNIDAVSQRLHAEPFAVIDPAFGEGTRLAFGPTTTPVTTLELYTLTSAARIRCQGLLIEVTGVAPPAVTDAELPADEESVVLSNTPKGNDLRVGIAAQGDVSLFVAASELLVLEQVSQETAEKAPKASGEEEALSTAEPETTAEQSQERISISGRVGADPTFRTTAKGVVLARFPVAQHLDGKTVWHQVLVFGERAELLREALKKGQGVDVVGYVHERQAHDNKDKIIKEIYAALVKTDRPPR